MQSYPKLPDLLNGTEQTRVNNRETALDLKLDTCIQPL